ncbi:hypothetical protein M976_02976 [Buttiauxella ferragutiae ATCC 51602]|jgi:hypothetical protein|uniref:Uncharacterized protein n=1 Tax=Buttiauxella ferragutiae ATCC 51602 TaxID=1354252 RepID=A0ABX2W5X7_9ENTR|nr:MULTISPECIES: hypothetical protein [Buttiauxella]AYN26284.1 hypothetical protein D8682_04285 [Buttiauxella sp. 3AFRM03]OAT26258.1 hypothetical protein M976_02976 [Buttiauxella ferragutiae ATCC 51602]UNK63413.1 hypothetical protein MNO13_11210 [Buttiauxella ferragutiae]
MKLWLSSLALLLASTSVWAAGNYRIVQSPSQKLDVWIDDVQNNTPQSWCAQELPLRIVANGDKNPALLNVFMPRLGTLLESQCSAVQIVSWRMEDPQGQALAVGTASRSSDWTVIIAPVVSSELNTQPAREENSPLADRTPWQEFTLQDGCHLRTFWQGDANSSAMFIPNGKCEKGGWLNGHSEIIQSGAKGETRNVMTFVHGFPVSGLSADAGSDSLLITSLNNERMVVSNEHAPQSWMILPYHSELNGWKATGMVAVEVPRELAVDEAAIQKRLNIVRKVWSEWLAPDTPITLLLIDSLRPQLRDPAVGAWRSQK